MNDKSIYVQKRISMGCVRSAHSKSVGNNSTGTVFCCNRYSTLTLKWFSVFIILASLVDTTNLSPFFYERDQFVTFQ
jgi:hypothetical protein